MVTVSVNYSTDINRDTVAQDTDMEALWRNTVKPWLIKHSFDVLGLSNYQNAGTKYISQEDTHNIDAHNYKITGRLTFTAPKTSTSIIAVDEKIEERFDRGLSVEKLWDRKDNTFNVWGIGSRTDLTRTITVTRMGQTRS